MLRLVVYLTSTLFKNPCILNLLNNFLVIRQKNVLFLHKTTFKGMEEASILPVGEIHTEDHHKADWKKCIICQENRFPIKKSFPYQKVPALEFLKWLTVVRLERSVTMQVTSSVQE